MSTQPTARHAAAFQLIQSGQFKAALKACKDGMRKNPSDPIFLNLAGMALSQSGNPREGAQHFAKALKLAPGDATFQDNLAMALVQAGHFDKAESLIARLLEKRKDKGALHYQLGVLKLQTGDVAAARDAATEAIASERTALEEGRKPKPEARKALARAHNLRAVALNVMGEEEDEFADYQAALEHDPDNPDTLANVSLPLSRRMRGEEALAALERALTVNPRHLNALHRYGIQLNENGRTTEAVDILEMALKVDPGNADILRELAHIVPRDRAADLAVRLDEALGRARKPSLDRARLAFGRAHCAERLRDTAAMLHWYGEANALAARYRPADPERIAREEARVAALFPDDTSLPFADRGPGPRMLFVVGLPRSGTTLTELVLSAHPRILGIGEQATAGRLARHFLDRNTAFGPEDAAALAHAYRDRLPECGPDAAVIVDKMPNNFKHLGFLLTAFPDAMVVNATRDPRDVAWSMWRNWFPARALDYTFDLGVMAAEANSYARTMRRWKALFPDRIHDIAYETLVGDVTGESRRLAEIAAVDWDEAMAAPERNRAAVRTASVNQVREGVNARSVGGWRVAAETLRPFIEGLDPDLWPGVR